MAFFRTTAPLTTRGILRVYSTAMFLWLSIGLDAFAKWSALWAAFHVLETLPPALVTFCVQDSWSGGDGWIGRWRRGIVSDLQTFASRHKWWAMVYDITEDYTQSATYMLTVDLRNVVKRR
jgi:hypothetical protein